MKKLSKLKLNDAAILNDREMKMVVGGEIVIYGPHYSGRQVCAASGTFTGPINYCTNDSQRAQDHAGSSGWWCCNCQEAITACSSLLVY